VVAIRRVVALRKGSSRGGADAADESHRGLGGHSTGGRQVTKLGTRGVNRPSVLGWRAAASRPNVGVTGSPAD